MNPPGQHTGTELDSESDGGQSADGGKTTEVIYSDPDQDYDSGRPEDTAGRDRRGQYILISYSVRVYLGDCGKTKQEFHLVHVQFE